MENFYSRVIYDTIQLILSKQFKRAILLCNFLIDKGFRTTELVIVLSYAYKMVQGAQKALEVLQLFTETKQVVAETDTERKVKSPLIDLANTQYHMENKQYQQALKSLQEFELLNDTAQQLNPSNLVSFLKSLKDNYSSIFQQSKVQSNSVIKNHPKEPAQSSTNIVQFFRRQINEVTQAYMMTKSSCQQDNQPNEQQNAIRYGQFYIQYDQIKQKILSILSNQLKLQSQTIFKVNTAKKRQTINQQTKKLKKQPVKQTLIKQPRPITGSVQKKNLNRTIDSQFMPKNHKPNQLEMPQTHLEELQILLVQVNRFIGFFKNSLKNYTLSRITQITPTNLQSTPGK